MLCIHACKFHEVKSYIRTGNGSLESTDKLKILGFTFGQEPNAIKHVIGVINKFYQKLWSLRFLKRSGMATKDLLHVYKTIIRSGAEYCAIVYGPLIPKYISDKLESVQKQALRTIYGWDRTYESLVEDGTVETLASRREQASLKFALKYKDSHRFGHWFPLNPAERTARDTTRRLYKENQCTTERTKSNPIEFRKRQLNANDRA